MKRRKDGGRRCVTEPTLSLSDEIVQILAESTPDADDVVGRVLAAVCRHFRFACGFVYERDDGGAFRLLDSFSAGAQVAILPRSFRLAAGQGERAVARMLAEPVVFEDAGVPALPNTVLLKAVPGDGVRPAGFVGITDRRRTIRRDRAAMEYAWTVLSLLANCVRIRMRQRGLEFPRQAAARLAAE